MWPSYVTETQCLVIPVRSIQKFDILSAPIGPWRENQIERDQFSTQKRRFVSMGFRVWFLQTHPAYLLIYFRKYVYVPTPNSGQTLKISKGQKRAKAFSWSPKDLPVIDILRERSLDRHVSNINY